ncbi:MAG TPA: hypothetical protein VFE23_04925 [Usitatibacter sp.]|nr:hypothetical protein [Usitatibacter sp.]
MNSPLNPITATLPLPGAPDARIDLPHLTCVPMVGLAEAALLFSASHVEAARRALEDACRRYPGETRAWAMRFDLHRALGEREAFEALRAPYGGACPAGPAPVWRTAAVGAGETTRLRGVLKGGTEYEELREELRSRRVVVLDFEDVTRIDFAFAPILCRDLRFLALPSRRVIVANAGELHGELLAAVSLHRDVTVLPRRAPDPGAVMPIDADALKAA